MLKKKKKKKKKGESPDFLAASISKPIISVILGRKPVEDLEGA